MIQVDAQRVKELRVRKGFSLDALAARSGICRRALQDIESGETLRPHPSTVQCLAKVFDVPPETLWLAPPSAKPEKIAPPVIIVTVRDGLGRVLSVYELFRKNITVGRDPANDVVLTDARISANHARVLVTSEGLEIRDLGSANGTFVNGQRIRKHRPLQADEPVEITPFVLYLAQTPRDPGPIGDTVSRTSYEV